MADPLPDNPGVIAFPPLFFTATLSPGLLRWT